MLTGPIPSSIGSCRLEFLYLGYNRLTGPIPKEVFLISTLLAFKAVPWNGGLRRAAQGRVAQAAEECRQAAQGQKESCIPEYSGNVAVSEGKMLTGSFPSDVGGLKNLEILDVSRNRLTGEIPDSLGDSQILQYCSMKGNAFQGEIPDSIGQLKGLVGLDLSRSNLSGLIPDFLGTMEGLQQLDISYDNFYGEVPKHDIFLNPKSKQRPVIRRLCPDTLSHPYSFSLREVWAQGNCRDGLKLPPCSNHSSQNPTGKRSRKIFMIVSIAAAISGVALLLALFVFCYHRRKSSKAEHALLLSDGMCERVSYANLMNARNSFSSENLIGIGSFSSVYKGTMMRNEEEVVVAVKVLNLQQRGASQNFIAECETLRCARHRNLVKILTASSSSIDSGGFDFKAIVFDFLPNGNLDQWLHDHHSEHGIDRSLDLAQPIDIAIHVASALEYLHHYKPTPIVHCDLKPSNILLDNDMVAHVGDFGHARFVCQDQTNLSDISSGWATRMGTIGYAATGQILASTIRYVQMALQDQQVAGVVDQQLLLVQDQEYEARICSSSSTKEMIVACIASILQIGILCSKELPTDHLIISDALRELQGVKD
ncbi:hypothetical protein U9M48_004491, partial [Paspalum notatum var. saurae]